MHLPIAVLTLCLVATTQFSAGVPLEADTAGGLSEQTTESSSTVQAATVYPNVRACVANEIVRYTFPGDPDIVRIDATSIYAGTWTSRVLESDVIEPLAKKLENALSEAKQTGESVWWQPMYEASLCLLRERLTADRQFETHLIDNRKTSAEAIFYRLEPNFPPIVTEDDIARYKEELAENKPNIDKARYSQDGLYPWMVGGYQARKRQLQMVIFHGPGPVVTVGYSVPISGRKL